MLIECAKRIIADLESNPHDEYYIRGGELIPDLKKDSEQRIAYNFCKTAIEKLQWKVEWQHEKLKWIFLQQWVRIFPLPQGRKFR